MAQQQQEPLLRRSVPNDNSCLFYSLAYLCKNADPCAKVERSLREVCAQAALTDPHPDTRALFLGHSSVQAYSEWIRNPHHWGGENEIFILAAHFGVEVVVVSCESLTTLCYNGGDDGSDSKKHRVYILYTGQHYDPLVGGTRSEEGMLSTANETRRFSVGYADVASALAIARQHNTETARKAKQRRVNRIKCGGCGTLLDDAPAFQAHCMEIEHDDDFAFDCEQVEVVVEDGEDLPEGSVDLTNEDKHFIYYNADTQSPFSSSWIGSFEINGKVYRTFEHYWQGVRYETTAPDLSAKIAATETVQAAIMLSNREGMEKVRLDWDDVMEDFLIQGLRAKFGATEKEYDVALKKALEDTAPKTIVCVDIDPWKGMTAAGGIATGQNHFGKALEAVRSELLEKASSPEDNNVR